MAMGRETGAQGNLMLSWSELPRSPGHAFYDRLQGLQLEAGFDAFVEEACKPFYALRMGAPSLPLGRYFRKHMVGRSRGMTSSEAMGEVRPDAEQFVKIPWRPGSCKC